MQKISSYIYPNRIEMVSDTGYFPTEFRLVYQRLVKIYQGLDNIIEFDIKNSQQRRIDVSTLTMKMVVMDENLQEVCTVDVLPIPQTTGLASCTLPAIIIDKIVPQLLTYSLYNVSNDVKTPIYGDAQFGLKGKLHLIGGALPVKLPEIVITQFGLTYDDHDPNQVIKNYYSESAYINPLNDNLVGEKFDVEFWPENLDVDITVQFSDSAVISHATTWYNIDNFTITPSTSLLTKTYQEIVDFSNNVVWMRIKYVPTNTNIGNFKKVIVKK